MSVYKYIGDDISISLRGVVFPHGEGVEVLDEGFQNKLDALPYFTSDKPQPEAVDEPDAESALVASLRKKIAGLELQLMKALRADVPSPAPAPADELEIPKRGADPVETFIPGETSSESDQEIPEDWRELHWKRQMVIAKKFTDMEIKTADDAVTIIEMEIERRGDQ